MLHVASMCTCMVTLVDLYNMIYCGSVLLIRKKSTSLFFLFTSMIKLLFVLPVNSNKVKSAWDNPSVGHCHPLHELKCFPFVSVGSS